MLSKLIQKYFMFGEKSGLEQTPSAVEIPDLGKVLEKLKGRQEKVKGEIAEKEKELEGIDGLLSSVEFLSEIDLATASPEQIEEARVVMDRLLHEQSDRWDPHSLGFRTGMVLARVRQSLEEKSGGE